MLDFIIFLIIGAIAGWIAGEVMRGRGFGIWGNIAVGILGALIGGFLFGALGFGDGGIIWSILTATIGAIILLAIISLFKRGSSYTHEQGGRHA
jgi:uncharacterized membrane protein YeaQ/YmgE (transglycosylase-associated protein family)